MEDRQQDLRPHRRGATSDRVDRRAPASAAAVGCKVSNLRMRAGLVPAAVCAECADITSHAATQPQSTGRATRADRGPTVRHDAASATAAPAGAPTVRRRGRARPVTAPITARPALTPAAGPEPSPNAAADAQPPAPATTATSSTIPNTPPSWRMVLNVPDALPASAGATAPMTAVWGGGNAIRHAGARDDERGDELAVVHARVGDHADPRHADRLQAEPSD